MIKELLEASGQRLLIPLVVVTVGPVLVRGIFSLARSRSQDRRDFLELFRDWEGRGDLWLSVAVRHVFGAYLPSALIRQLMASPHPGRALMEVSNAWGYLDMHDETGELYWRRGWLRRARVRRTLIWLLPVLYFPLAAAGALLGFRALIAQASGLALVSSWVYTVALCGAAIFCLGYGDDLKDAHRAASRWLGLS